MPSERLKVFQARELRLMYPQMNLDQGLTADKMHGPEVQEGSAPRGLLHNEPKDVTAISQHGDSTARYSPVSVRNFTNCREVLA
jgi:hypothetical protein